MTRFILFFQWKMHLIKVLELVSHTTDLRIWPLKSRSSTVELFLSLSRTPPQNLGRNGHHLTIQMASQSSGDKEILHSSLLLSFSSVLPLSNSLPFFLFFFKAKKAHFLYFKHQPDKPITKAQINSLCFNNTPAHCTAQYSKAHWIIFYFFSFIYFHLLIFHFQILFFLNTQINLLTPIQKFNFLNFINN